MIRLMSRQPFHGVTYEGTTYDCGDKVGVLAANVAFALERADVGPGFRDVLRKILAEQSPLAGDGQCRRNPLLDTAIAGRTLVEPCEINVRLSRGLHCDLLRPGPSATKHF